MRQLEFRELEGKGKGLLVGKFRTKAERTTMKTIIQMVYAGWQLRKKGIIK